MLILVKYLTRFYLTLDYPFLLFFNLPMPIYRFKFTSLFLLLTLLSSLALSMENSIDYKKNWLSLLEAPKSYVFEKSLTLLKRYEFKTLDIEVYRQANGIGTFQTLYIALPKNLKKRAPTVVVPYYNPEQMLGFFPDSLKQADSPNIAIMRHLAERGFIVATAETYHLTYIKSDKHRKDFSRWNDAGHSLMKDYPRWSGMGKLVFDTQLIIDILQADNRVDAENIGIAGHSLGGKIAFYVGCIDPRIKVILASDFGIAWEQSNWHDIWYWGEKLEKIKADGLNHAQLLDMANAKPFVFLAGKYDNNDSLKILNCAKSYSNFPDRLLFINHAKGHRPPLDVLEQGYDFLEKYLCKKKHCDK